MPHQLTLLGSSPNAVLRRGAVKANLIHHLAHTGGTNVLRRIGRAYAPPRDWIPASGRPVSASTARAFDAAFGVATPRLSRRHPVLATLARAAGRDEFWAHFGLAFHFLRVWEGDEPFRDALAHADAALRFEPDWAWGYLLRGEIKRSLIDYAGAALDLHRAAALDPGWSWAEGFLSRALFQRGTDASGLEPLDRAVTLGPREGFLRCWRAEAYRRLGRTSEAQREFSEGLSLDPLYDQGYGWRARLLDAQGRHDEAAADLRRGIDLCPHFEKAHRQLVRSLRGAGKTGAALRELDRAATLNHRNNWLGVWRVEGHPDDATARQALAEIDAHLARRPRDARALAWKGETLAQIGRLTEAIDILDAALNLKADDAWALCWRGEALLGLGRVAEARADLDRAIVRDASYGRAWAWRGRVRLLCGDFEGAENDLTRALSVKRVEYSWICAWRGEARLELGRLEDATRDFDAVLALDPGQARFRRLRARAARGEAAGAQSDLDAARVSSDFAFESSTPVLWGHLPWRTILAVEERRLAGDARGGLRRLNPVVRRHGGEAPWLYILRYRLRRALGAANAHRDVDLAFRRDPNSGWIAGLVAAPPSAARQALLLRDSWRGFADDASCAPLHAYHGHDLFRRGDATGGLKALERAVGLEPSAWILAWLGEALRSAGRPEEARAALDRALALDARYDNAWAWRATLKLAEADAAGALTDLRRAIALRPTARALHELARTLRALGRTEDSLDALASAARLNAELGWSGLRDEAAPQALEEIRALRVRRDGPRLREWEADALLRLGQPGQALAILKGARSAWARTRRAEALLQLEGPSSRALEEALAASRGDPRWAKSRAVAAQATLRAGDTAAAAVHAAAAVRLNPFSARLRVLRAEALAASGRRRAAKRELERARALAPGYALARQRLEELQFGRPIDAPSLIPASDPIGGEPKSLEFFVNYSCNAKCPFCFNPPDASAELERGLPLRELAARLLSGWREGYRAVKFIGGEVTVREDLPQILAAARQIGYRSIQLTTNGLRLADPAYARRLVTLGVNRVRFSVHGHLSELHDRLVGVPGALAKIELAAGHLRPLGVSLGVNYVLNRVNVGAFPETLDWLYGSFGVDDVIVYFLRYQGFGALLENKNSLKLSFSEAVGPVREGLSRLRARGTLRMPQLIHFTPCVAPEWTKLMADWTRDPAGSGQGNTSEDRVTMPDGTTGLIHAVTNSGKRPVAACAFCAIRERCLGVEENYVSEFGENEFHPLRLAEVAA